MFAPGDEEAGTTTSAPGKAEAEKAAEARVEAPTVPAPTLPEPEAAPPSDVGEKRAREEEAVDDAPKANPRFRGDGDDSEDD